MYPDPIIYLKRRPTIWSVPCAVTGNRIPCLTMAYKRWKDYAIRDEINSDVDWVSEAGFVFLKLQGELGDIDVTDDPGPW